MKKQNELTLLDIQNMESEELYEFIKRLIQNSIYAHTIKGKFDTHSELEHDIVIYIMQRLNLFNESYGNINSTIYSKFRGFCKTYSRFYQSHLRNSYYNRTFSNFSSNEVSEYGIESIEYESNDDNYLNLIVENKDVLTDEEYNYLSDIFIKRIKNISYNNSIYKSIKSKFSNNL